VFRISPNIAIPESEINMEAVRAGGPGGQNVNKVSSAIHLRFDIPASSLPEEYKQRLLKMRDRRVTRDGVLVIKAQRFRSRELNRQDALDRLREFIRHGVPQRRPVRKLTRPTLSAKKRRIEEKRRRGKIKQLRRKVSDFY
jgi:ribosome-associated protein